MRLFGGYGMREGAWVADSITDEHGDRWTVEAWVTIRRGRPVIGEIRVFPAAGPAGRFPGDPWKGTPADVPRGGLERRLLVKVPVGRYVAFVMAQAAAAAMVPGPAQAAVIAGHGVNLAWLNKMLPGADTLAPRPRERRSVGRDDAFYARLGVEYVERLAAGSVSPVKDLAARRGESPGRIRDLLHEARVRGLLSKGEAGKRGGYLLPRARQVLGGVQRTPNPPRRRKR